MKHSHWMVTIKVNHRSITLKKYVIWSWKRRRRPTWTALTDHEWGIWWLCFGLLLERRTP